MSSDMTNEAPDLIRVSRAVQQSGGGSFSTASLGRGYIQGAYSIMSAGVLEASSVGAGSCLWEGQWKPCTGSVLRASVNVTQFNF